MLEYTIVDGNDKRTVIETINLHLMNDWELNGILCICSTLVGNKIIVHYAQSLVRYSEIQQ